MRIIIAVLLLLLSCGTVSADPNVYCMSLTGSNSNTGMSEAQAWANLSHAQTVLTAGDTLYVCAGTYYNEYYVPQSNGTEEYPITICPTPGAGRPLFIGDCTDPVPTHCGATQSPNWGHWWTAGNNSNPSQPAEWYVISGFEMRDYGAVIEPWCGTNHIEVSDLIVRNCSYVIHWLHDVNYVNASDCLSYDTYYTPYHLWYDNHHNRVENCSAFNIRDHGLIDLHTNNDNNTFIDVSFYGELYDGELIYFHGDRDTNDNNTFINISMNVTNNAGQEAVDIWSMGWNNYFENISIVNDDTHTAFRIMSSTGANNFIAKNVNIVSRGYHSVILSSCIVKAENILLENFTVTGSNQAGYLADFGIQSSNFENFTIRNPRGGTNSTLYIPLTYYATDPLTVEYTDGTVFEENYDPDYVLYSPARSYIEIHDNVTGSRIYMKNVTLKPTSSYLQNVTVSRDSNITYDITEFEVNSTVASNPTNFTAMMQNESRETYSISIDGVHDGNASVYDHILTYYHTFTQTPETILIEWSHNQPFSADQSKLYFNTTFPIKNSINSTGYCAHNRTITWDDTESALGIAVVVS